MPVHMPTPIRRRAITLAALAAALALPLATTGCGALDKALDCVQTADAIAGSVNNLQQALANLGDNPLQAEQALDDIDTELDKLQDSTDNADLSTAVDHLNTGVDNVRTAIKNGDDTPDLTPVTDAATEVGKVCTP